MKEKIAAIQGVLGVSVDGIWGPKSQAALDALVQAPQSALLVDPRSEVAIATLHRLVQPKARELLKLASGQGIAARVTSGTRTYAEQDALFDKHDGTTKARGGYSNHNFGLAFDLTIFNGEQPIWESIKYVILGRLGKSIGLTWGGDWVSIQDEPHFELHPPWAQGMSEEKMVAELRRRHDNGIDAFA